eukprot:Gregarina_sp_Poly_1__3480@NODE_200_length_11544_cov_123_517644_g179_i0_p11_GENE_NODE_200_length_11544_cov_123_517644_g179_i0NODE_200_length_11544_cov_123_517644_g179_i0_p11_ORF_typecomplete_len111_score10_26Fiji_64_capsid/PF05880_11/0_01_NODE_200_length_11544_cov_123_517644_g179_i073587690
MELEDQELFYSPDHKDRRQEHGYDIDDITDIIHLKSYLRRERQISETRLKAIEQKDDLIALLTTNQSQYDKGRLDMLESRLNVEIRNQKDMTDKLRQCHFQLDEYKFRTL